MRDHRGLVVGGYEFDDVQNGRAPGADQLAGPQHLGGQQASWLGRVGAWHGRGVYDVAVQAAVERVSAIRYDVQRRRRRDRKSTRLNSSHANISYAVFCLKKKKNITEQRH